MATAATMPEVGVKAVLETADFNAKQAQFVGSLGALTDALKKQSAQMEAMGKTAKKAEEPQQKLTGSLDKLKDGAGQVGGVMLRSAMGFAAAAAGAVGLGVGLGALARQVIEGNAELEKMENQVAGTLFAFRDWNKGVSSLTAFRASLRDTRKDITPLLEAAESDFAVPMTSMANSLQTLLGPLSDVGVAEDKILKLTTQTGAAMRLFGGDAAQHGAVLSRLIGSGMISTKSTDPFTAFLRSATRDLGDLKKAGPAKIFEAVTKAMNQLGPAAKEASHTFEGAMFRLKDFLGDTVRDVGGPAFKYISGQIEHWTEVLAQTNDQGQTMAEVWGGRVLNAVTAVGDAFNFMVEHAKLLGKALSPVVDAMTKVAEVTSPAVGGFFRQLGNTMGIDMGPSDDQLAGQMKYFDKKDMAFRQFVAGKKQPNYVDPNRPVPGQIPPMLRALELPPTGALVKPGKPVINQRFGDVNISQTFRDQEPDAVYVALREGLEGQASRRVQSALVDSFGG